ncbi:pirin family protein [Gillisia marina]|uniref:pirin family protein n=1 Tax=Gillisia marina TaxID=1167637 RepID=UPI00029A37C9|nr:pirin family protein [Gillisia marina]
MENNKIKSIKPMGFPWETRDPFLFCAHHRDEYPKGNEKLGPATSLAGRNIGQDFTIKDGWRMYHGSTMPGFPYHPHRGFETITINKEGFVDHTDSLGAAGRFGAGDVQWMTAGKGVQHSEMFPLLKEGEGNPLEIFQVWLNLPKANKMVEPHFKMLWAEDIPVVTITDANGGTSTIDVIAGSFNDTKALAPTPDSWAADPANAVSVLTIKMDAHAELRIPASNLDVNRTLYFYKGEKLVVEDKTIEEYHLIDVVSTEDIFLKNGSEEGYLLMLQGRPINEPVAQYGPFVMNTQQEIQQAMQDFQRTQFGGWPWPEREQAHARDKGRFALHADGSEEIK